MYHIGLRSEIKGRVNSGTLEVIACFYWFPEDKGGFYCLSIGLL